MHPRHPSCVWRHLAQIVQCTFEQLHQQSQYPKNYRCINNASQTSKLQEQDLQQGV